MGVHILIENTENCPMGVHILVENTENSPMGVHIQVENTENSPMGVHILVEYKKDMIWSFNKSTAGSVVLTAGRIMQ